MNSFALATKIWAQAQKENNRLVLDNTSIEDVRIVVKDHNVKSVKKGIELLNNIVIRAIEFRGVQARKNAA